MPNMRFKSVLFAAILGVFGGMIGVNAQTVTGSIANGTVTRGKAARGTVVLTVPGGLHVNSSRPAAEYMIPTTVKISSASGVKLSAVTYPKGVDRKYEFSDKAVNTYEGRVSFPFTVTAGDTFRGREVVVTATVNYQACTNEVCYAPKSKTVKIKARVE